MSVNDVSPEHTIDCFSLNKPLSSVRHSKSVTRYGMHFISDIYHMHYARSIAVIVKLYNFALLTVQEAVSLSKQYQAIC